MSWCDAGSACLCFLGVSLWLGASGATSQEPAQEKTDEPLPLVLPPLRPVVNPQPSEPEPNLPLVLPPLKVRPEPASPVPSASPLPRIVQVPAVSVPAVSVPAVSVPAVSVPATLGQVPLGQVTPNQAAQGPADPITPAPLGAPPIVSFTTPGPGQGLLLWVKGEYLLGWLSPDRVPTLGNSYLVNVPGAPGSVIGLAANGTLLSGDFPQDDRSGTRLTVGVWLDSQQTWALEGNYFFLGQTSHSAGVTSGRSLFVPQPPPAPPPPPEQEGRFAGPQALGLIGAIGAVLPMEGTLTVDSTSLLQGAELNLLRNLAGSPAAAGLRFDALAGIRFLDLREGLVLRENLRVPANTQGIPETTFALRDSFQTSNQFFGGQVGLTTGWQGQRFYLDMTTKIALGCTQEKVNIEGATLIGNVATPGGDLTGPLNIGTHRRDVFSVVPEARLEVGFRVTEFLKVYAGYSVLYWSNVARPGDHLGSRVCVATLPPAASANVAPATFSFRGSDLWIHGLLFGMKLEY